MTETLADFEHRIEQLPPPPAASEHLAQPEVVDSSGEHIATAENILRIVSDAPSEDTIGERVAEIAKDASDLAREHPTPETAGEATVLGDAEALSILEGSDPTGAAAESLGVSRELPAVIFDLNNVDPTHQAVEEVARRIDEAEERAKPPHVTGEKMGGESVRVRLEDIRQSLLGAKMMYTSGLMP